jgi:hypothetical protein
MNAPRVIHFTMTEAEATQHLHNLERAAESADRPGQEAIKAVLLVVRREYEKSLQEP